MTDLDLLASFLEIYRRGSLTAAATALGVSQPAVSGQLARLEPAAVLAALQELRARIL